jgi:hypothetical protein
MTIKLLILTFSIFFSTLAFSYDNVTTELPIDDFEVALAKEEALLNLYSQKIRGQLPLNTFYQILVQWGEPKGFIDDLKEAYILLENDEITIEEAEVYLEETISRLNKAQQTSQKYSDLVDKVRFFLAALPLVMIITE